MCAVPSGPDLHTCGENPSLSDLGYRRSAASELNFGSRVEKRHHPALPCHIAFSALALTLALVHLYTAVMYR